jgi:hypothetical protein
MKCCNPSCSETWRDNHAAAICHIDTNSSRNGTRDVYHNSMVNVGERCTYYPFLESSRDRRDSLGFHTR